jgi:hypothetical protein
VGEVEEAMVQTLFPAVGKEYFTVNPSLAGCSPTSPFAVLISSVLPAMPPLEQKVPVEGREIPPFHRVTQWWEMLGSAVDSRNSRREVVALAAVPTRHEAELAQITVLTRRYLVEAQHAAQNAGYNVRKKLVPDAEG